MHLYKIRIMKATHAHHKHNYKKNHCVVCDNKLVEFGWIVVVVGFVVGFVVGVFIGVVVGFVVVGVCKQLNSVWRSQNRFASVSIDSSHLN